MAKQPFDIDEALRLIEVAVEPYPKAAMFELAEQGYRSPFELLVACIISIRTRDEETLRIAPALFALARTPAAMQALTVEQIDSAIALSTFHENKAYQIHNIALQIVKQHDGQLPLDQAVLLAFHGVGPKCANLVLGISGVAGYIGVDIHVHRVTNRWGYVATNTPEQTMVALEQSLPPRYWVTINRLLVPFGKHICTGSRPKCSTCPVLAMCQQVSVTNPR